MDLDAVVAFIEIYTSTLDEDLSGLYKNNTCLIFFIKVPYMSDIRETTECRLN